MKRTYKIMSSVLAAAVCLGSTATFGAGAAETGKGESKRIIIGDVNGDSKVNISDVTEVQRWLAMAKELDEYAIDAADANQNKEVKINDATLIQSYCADISGTNNYCGQPKKDGELIGVYDYIIYDFLNWNKFSIVAKDKEGNVLPMPEPVFKDTHLGFDESDKYGEFSVPVPNDAYSLTAVSADGTKQTHEAANLDRYYSSVYGIVNHGTEENPDYYLVDCDIHWAMPSKLGFCNTLGWENVYVYRYNSNDGSAYADWPGELLTADYNENGGDFYYFYTYEESYDSIILNDGKGNQTDTITDFYPANGYYYLREDAVTTNEYGGEVYIPLVDSYVPPVQEKEYYTFDFSNSLYWDKVYMFAYDSDGRPYGAEYPGNELTDFELSYGTQIYTVTVPKDTAGVIFSSDKGEKTEVITDFEPNGGGYYLDEKDTSLDVTGAKQYNVQPFEGNPVFTFTNTLNWEEVYVYAYNTTYGTVGKDWPGKKLTPEFTNGFNLEVYRIEFPEEADGIILTDGKGHQTTDITEINPNGSYFLDEHVTTTDQFGQEVYELIPLTFDMDS